MTNFATTYEPFFQSVFRLIPGSWRIDQREITSENTHRIKVINPDYRHIFILIGCEKNRFKVSIHVDRKVSPYVMPHSCSISMTRSAVSAANDINNKIVVKASDMMAMALKHQNEHRNKLQNLGFLKNCLARLFDLKTGFDCLCYFRKKHIYVTVKERYSENYSIQLDNLSQDELIKIAGFISTFEEKNNDFHKKNQ